MTTVITMMRQMSLSVDFAANHIRQLDERICEVRQMVAEVQRNTAPRGETSANNEAAPKNDEGRFIFIFMCWECKPK